MIAFAFLYRFGLRPARQDGAAVPDRLARQRRARALEPGAWAASTAPSAAARSSPARCWAASSCRRVEPQEDAAAPLPVHQHPQRDVLVPEPGACHAEHRRSSPSIVIIEKLGWGIGAVGHMIYMMQQIAPGPYKTAHYTFATGADGRLHDADRRGQRLRPEGGRLPVVLHHRACSPRCRRCMATMLAPFHHPDVTKQPAKA